MGWLDDLSRYRHELSAELLSTSIEAQVENGEVHLDWRCPRLAGRGGVPVGTMSLSDILGWNRCAECLDSWMVPVTGPVLNAALRCHLRSWVARSPNSSAWAVHDAIVAALNGETVCRVQPASMGPSSRRMRRAWKGAYGWRPEGPVPGGMGVAVAALCDLVVHGLPAGFADGWQSGVRRAVVVGDHLVVAGTGWGIDVVGASCAFLSGASSYAEMDGDPQLLDRGVAEVSVALWKSGVTLDDAVLAAVALGEEP